MELILVWLGKVVGPFIGASRRLLKTFICRIVFGFNLSIRSDCPLRAVFRVTSASPKGMVFLNMIAGCE
jgi:hypothetical protein